MITPSAPVLRAESLVHRHAPSGVLEGVSLVIPPGVFTLLSGAPASGAGLLLRVLGLLEAPDSGEVWLDATAAFAMEEAARLDLRNRRFGFLFAEPFLLDSFTVAENVAMPLFKIAGVDIEQARARTGEVLHFAGIGSIADDGVTDLDPLDRHKVSLARALAVAPRVLIAEDACLQLPPRDAGELAALLRSVPPLLGISVIATSPASGEALAVDREVRLERGVIVADSHPFPLHEAPTHD